MPARALVAGSRVASDSAAVAADAGSGLLDCWAAGGTGWGRPIVEAVAAPSSTTLQGFGESPDGAGMRRVCSGGLA